VLLATVWIGCLRIQIDVFSLSSRFPWTAQSSRGLLIFFFLLILALSLYRLWRRAFLTAVRAMAARCKLSFALRPGLSHEDRDRTKEITK
jgi:hypothetical protein